MRLENPVIFSCYKFLVMNCSSYVRRICCLATCNVNFSCYKLDTDEFQMNLLSWLVLVGVACGLFKGTYYSAQIMRQCVVQLRV